MKNLFILLIVLLSALLSANAKPTVLFLNDAQTVTISFPAEVRYSDFGSEDILGKKTSHGKIISLRSAIPLFSETTASIVTADGKYYSYLIKYCPALSVLAIDMTKQDIADSIQVVKCEKIYSAQLSDSKTSHIIFSERVTDIISSSDSIIADYAENIDNIIKCKAVAQDFPPTTLTMITKNGNMYPFLIQYNAKPDVLSMTIEAPIVKNEELDNSGSAMFNDQSVNENKLKEYGRKLFEKGPQIFNIGTISQNMQFGLYGVFIHNDILAFHFNLKNDTNIDYEIDFMKLYVKDKKDSKKTAVQEEELSPIYIYNPNNNDGRTIKGKTDKSTIMFFKRFTIPKERVLYVEVFEKNGGRHIKFQISDKEILKAIHF